MGSPYHQFCPVAKALELLDERWTLLVVRELIMGSTRFNELRRGNPRMSPTLLSRRLHQLTRAGVVERRSSPDGTRYVLTAAGRELEPVVRALGVWGTRWVPELAPDDLDPKLLLWDVHRNVVREVLPAGRTVVQFRFPDLPPRSGTWWLVMTPDDVEVCDVDPGFEADLRVTTTLGSLTDVWRGERGWSESLRTGRLAVEGPEALRRALPDWFALSAFAAVPRP
jgi:DNA-binding HxlR family transcriptional regulator